MSTSMKEAFNKKPREKMKKLHVYRALRNIRVIGLGAALVLMTLAAANCEAHTFDCEGPSGEAMIAEEHAENERNKDSYDRCMRGEGSDRDYRQGDQYLRENVARTRELVRNWNLLYDYR